jgi:citrate synthase
MAWLTAEQAIAALKVKPQTLYANVSRGKIAARPDPKDPRRSLYSARDVERMARKPRGAPRTERVASGTLTWGDPVLTTGVSTVERGRLLYRGVDAVELARTADLEGVAGTLWQTDVAPVDVDAGSGEPRLRLFRAFGERAAVDPPSLGRGRSALTREAASLLSLAAAAASGVGGELPAHVRLAEAWSAPPEPIRKALALLADHELNASTFAARVAVSTGASPAAGVLAGLAALTGPRHGGAGAAVSALKTDAERLGAEAALSAWLAQGRPLAAFGHPLYPDGDVRAAALLEGVDMGEDWRALADAGERVTGEPPNVDFALAVLADRHGWPAEAPFLVFAVARTSGWLAHALEQALEGELIRPRARYGGPKP